MPAGVAWTESQRSNCSVFHCVPRLLTGGRWEQFARNASDPGLGEAQKRSVSNFNFPCIGVTEKFEWRSLSRSRYGAELLNPRGRNNWGTFV
jgi:hypothetical protein